MNRITAEQSRLLVSKESLWIRESKKFLNLHLFSLLILFFQSNDESSLIDELQYLFAEDIDIDVGRTITSSLLKKDGTYLGIVTLYRMSEKK